ncbi:hypothetical protein IT575_12495 [bacterium]|nr:hypothetical protein [bacterium]
MLPPRLLAELESRVQSTVALYWLVVVLACISLCPLLASLLRLMIWFLNALDPNILDEQPGDLPFGGPVVWYSAGLLLALLAMGWALAYSLSQKSVTRRDLQDHVLLCSFADEQYELAVNALKQERSNRKLVAALPRKDLFAKLQHFAMNYRDYKYLAGDRRELPLTNFVEAQPALDCGLALLANLAAFNFVGVAVAGPILLRILLIYPRLSAIMLAVIEELRSGGAHDAGHRDDS